MGSLLVLHTEGTSFSISKTWLSCHILFDPISTEYLPYWEWELYLPTVMLLIHSLSKESL